MPLFSKKGRLKTGQQRLQVSLVAAVGGCAGAAGGAVRAGGTAGFCAVRMVCVLVIKQSACCLSAANAGASAAAAGVCACAYLCVNRCGRAALWMYSSLSDCWASHPCTSAARCVRLLRWGAPTVAMLARQHSHPRGMCVYPHSRLEGEEGGGRVADCNLGSGQLQLYVHTCVVRPRCASPVCCLPLLYPNVSTH